MSNTTNAKSPPAPSQADLYSLVLEIRKAKAARLEGLQAIVDGAVLAVEQIQDQRIVQIEQGPEVTIDEIIFDFLLGLALGGVGNKLKTITDIIAKQLADSVVEYASLAKNKKFANVLGSAIVLFDAKKFASDSNKVTPMFIRNYNQVVREIIAEKIGKDLEIATQKSLATAKTGVPKSVEEAVTGVITGKAAKEVKLEPTDSPSVAMLSAAQSFVSKQRYIQTLAHDSMEIVVLSGQANTNELNQIRKAVTLKPLEASYETIRDRNKMLFEAVIWAHLLKVNGVKWDSRNKEIYLGGATAPLRKYLYHRFERTIQIVLELPETKTWYENQKVVQKKPGWELKDQAALLASFFDKVNSDFRKVLLQTNVKDEDCGFTTTVSLIPKKPN
jgi:hypothetical protein